jgi:tRNA dimethylallyltransferase
MKSSTKVERRAESKDRAVVLFGPTAVGKTGLTEELFSRGYEIINADSIQVYRGLSIASAKPDEALRRKIRHHLVDIRDPWEEYTSGEFCHDTDSLIREINDRGSIPLITGGTAYYFKMLLYGRGTTPQADDEIRGKVQNLLSEKGGDWLYGELGRVDPVSKERINRNDIYRITRALEVYYQTGRPLSSFPVGTTLRDDVDFTVIGLERDKEELKQRIDERVEIMFREGAVDEMRSLLENGAQKSWPSMEAIGYREWFDALESGEYSLRGVRECIKRNSVKYAKRQMTFFRSFESVNWFNPSDTAGIRRLLESRGLVGNVENVQ